MCMSSLHRGHAHLLCIAPIFWQRFDQNNIKHVVCVFCCSGSSGTRFSLRNAANYMTCFSGASLRSLRFCVVILTRGFTLFTRFIKNKKRGNLVCCPNGFLLRFNNQLHLWLEGFFRYHHHLDVFRLVSFPIMVTPPTSVFKRYLYN